MQICTRRWAFYGSLKLLVLAQRVFSKCKELKLGSTIDTIANPHLSLISDKWIDIVLSAKLWKTYWRWLKRAYKTATWTC